MGLSLIPPPIPWDIFDSSTPIPLPDAWPDPDNSKDRNVRGRCYLPSRTPVSALQLSHLHIYLQLHAKACGGI